MTSGGADVFFRDGWTRHAVAVALQVRKAARQLTEQPIGLVTIDHEGLVAVATSGAEYVGREVGVRDVEVRVEHSDAHAGAGEAGVPCAFGADRMETPLERVERLVGSG